MHLKIEDIYEILNGPSERKELLLEHIKNCKRCRELFEIRKSFINSIRNIKRVSIPSDFSSEVIFEIEKRKSFLKRLSFALSSIPILISSLLVLSISTSGFPREDLSHLVNQYISIALKLFKFFIKIAMGFNKIVSSSLEIFKKFSSASSSLAIPIFAIFIILILSSILFLILLNYFPLRGVRDENS